MSCSKDWGVYSPYTAVHRNPLHVHVCLKLKYSFSFLKFGQVAGITKLSANTVRVPEYHKGLYLLYGNILYSDEGRDMKVAAVQAAANKRPARPLTQTSSTKPSL